MTEKHILIEPIHCNGCGDCERACSLEKTGEAAPDLSRIQVFRDEGAQAFFLPVLCMQCSDPPCLAVCPKNAVIRDEALDRVLIDYGLCVGCRMCVAACPFGAVKFDVHRGRPYKCDLCGGDPACTKSCEPGALTYVESLQAFKAGSVADKFLESMDKNRSCKSYRIYGISGAAGFLSR